MDVNHWWGGDISASANGDISKIDGINLGIQRVYRRLMTAPGEVIWHANYGAGLPQRIGRVLNIPVLKAIIRSLIFKEACVSKTPPPQIAVSADATGFVFVRIQYVDAFAKAAVKFGFPVKSSPVSQSQESVMALEVPTP